ncbi:hypothetical protein [Pontibacter mangrovi]|uniref:Uncharacterized protein n=1 Tax=Pontibacter mangrovi TaxID=2589816 RepID=A0A501W5A4_9BACT|nr:hypothetical protein [Pontibacter mangrovi]TPE45133.1 hypothetical protein FJM65_03570 [Pontibacter mangrovi]
MLLVVAFSILTLGSVKGQEAKFDVYGKVELARQELVTSKVDTFLIYTTGCVGCYILYEKGQEPPCACEGEGVNAKIIWQKDGKSYLKQISCCYENVMGLKELPDVFSFYENNKAILQKTEIGIRKVKADGAIIISVPASISHYSFQEVEMRQGTSEYEFELKDYQKEGEYSKAWKRYEWLEAQIKWVELIDEKLTSASE